MIDTKAALTRQAIFTVLDEREWDFEDDEQRVDFADRVASFIPSNKGRCGECGREQECSDLYCAWVPGSRDDKVEQVLTPEVLDKVERYGMHGISYGERTPVVLALVKAARHYIALLEGPDGGRVRSAEQRTEPRRWQEVYDTCAQTEETIFADFAAMSALARTLEHELTHSHVGEGPPPHAHDPNQVPCSAPEPTGLVERIRWHQCEAARLMLEFTGDPMRGVGNDPSESRSKP